MKIKKLMTGVMAAVMLAIPVMGVYASDGEEYVTITVQASDDNEGITYALDSDDPDNFGQSNMFTILAGTSHTIYVKDAAGNITSQVYEPEPEPEPEQPVTEPPEPVTVEGSHDTGEYSMAGADTDSADHSETETVDASYEYDGQTIDIDLELIKDGSGDEKPYEIKPAAPAEQGEGTVHSKTFLDGTDSSEQVFYSMTTAEGNVFYLLIDQGQESNNVYLLNQVNNQDLKALAVDGENTPQGIGNDGEDSLLKALSSGSGDEGNIADNDRPAAKGGVNKSTFIMLIIIAAGGGFYYYQKVYKTKKEQEMDAMEAADMDQFSVAGEADEEDFDFEYGDDDREQYLKELIKEDEEEYAAAARKDAADMGWNDSVENGEPDEEMTDISGEGISEAEPAGDREDIDIFDDTGLDGEYDPELDGEEEEDI